MIKNVTDDKYSDVVYPCLVGSTDGTVWLKWTEGDGIVVRVGTDYPDETPVGQIFHGISTHLPLYDGTVTLVNV